MVVSEKFRITFSTLLIFILLLSSSIPIINSDNSPKLNGLQTSPSCTIFTVAIGDTVFYGNNEDWRREYLSKLGLWFIPSQNISTIGGERSIYGGVFVGFLDEEKGDLYLNPCGGMNEHGLIFDINGLPSLALKDNPNGSSFWTNNIGYISPSLWDCKNVEEVIEWYKTYKWDTIIGGQLHYADASGDAVVISVNPSTNKWAFTRKTGNFIISTNFNLNDTSNAYDYPCPRYKTATRMLSKIENEQNLTVQACADILYAVHMHGECTTLYSNIFDPVNLDAYFNYGESYQKQKKINLLDVLSNSKFDLFNISYMTGVEGDMLVKLVRIDDNFYSSPKNSPPHLEVPIVIVLASALCVISLAVGVYVYKRKVKSKVR